MKALIYALIFAALPITSHADWFLDPRVAVGFNPAQGTYFMLGADLGFELTEQLRAGIGGYYAAGEEPNHDREYGGGPFVSYVQPLASFLMASVRQEINYVNMYGPIENAMGETVGHIEESGVASGTSAALHIFFTPNFVLSGGYRLVVALSNEAVDDGRSGAFLGLAFGI